MPRHPHGLLGFDPQGLTCWDYRDRHFPGAAYMHTAESLPSNFPNGRPRRPGDQEQDTTVVPFSGRVGRSASAIDGVALCFVCLLCVICPPGKAYLLCTDSITSQDSGVTSYQPVLKRYLSNRKTATAVGCKSQQNHPLRNTSRGIPQSKHTSNTRAHSSILHWSAI